MTAHLFVAHIAVAFLVVGATADVGGAVVRSAPVRRFAGTLLLIGSAGALLAFVTGEGAVSAALARIPPGDSAMEIHSRWGAVGTWVIAGSAVLRGMWWKRLEGTRGLGALALALVSGAIAVALAVTGAEVSHRA